MAEREKVIRGIEACVGDVRIMRCRECPYNGIPCITTLLRDALALIKEQRDRIKGLLECANILSDALDEKEGRDG